MLPFEAPPAKLPVTAHRFSSEASQLLSFVAATEAVLQADDDEGVRVRSSVLEMLAKLQGILTEVQTQTVAVMLEGPPEITVKSLDLCGTITGLTAELYSITAGELGDHESSDALRREIHEGTLRFAMHAHVLI
jgi:hypothetical protein